MTGNKTARLAAAMFVLVTSIGFVGIVGPRSASACVADTDGDCWRPNYQTQRTDGSLAVWTGPGIGKIEYSLGGNGTRVEVVCEATGAKEDGQPYIVWDQMDDGGWVYGYYLNTPGDGYHPALTLCNDVPPPQATGITATTTGTTTVHVSWTDNSGGAAQYLVGNGSYSRPSSPLPAGTTSYDWTGLGPNTTTCFNVLASNVFGNSGWSPSSCATTLPAVATNVSAVAVTAHTVRVSWTAPPGGAAQYVVDNSKTASANLPSSQTAYYWRAIPASTYMCFTIAAKNAGGQGGWSPYACATTPSAPANDYVNLGDSLSAGEGTLSYTSSTSNSANQCHRSTSSYSGQYAGGLSGIYHSVDNVACSGAVSSEFNTAYSVNGKNHMQVPDAGEGPQAAALNSSTDLVTVSMGINNVNFASVLNTCYGANVGFFLQVSQINSCFVDKLTNPQPEFGNQTLSAYIDQQEPILEQLFSNIQSDAPNATVVAVTYPLIYPRTFNSDPSTANTGNCAIGPLAGEVLTSQQQLDLIYATENHLDNVVRTAAAKIGIRVLDEETKFSGHDLCAYIGSPDPWANTVIVTPNGAGNDSFHPNTSGHGQIAHDLRNLIGY